MVAPTREGMPKSPLETDLLAAARAGDPAARDALVRRYWPRVFALGLQLSGSRAEAEDLAQDVMMAALAALPTFRGQSELFTWLYRIAVRKALRVRQRRMRMEQAQGPDDTRLELALQVDAGNDPRKQLELREQYQMLLCALDALLPKLRAAVILVAVHGLSLPEAGEALGIAPGTVGWRVHEARSQMRRTLERLSQPRTSTPASAGLSDSARTRASSVDNARERARAHAAETLESLRALVTGYAELESLTWKRAR